MHTALSACCLPQALRERSSCGTVPPARECIAMRTLESGRHTAGSRKAVGGAVIERREHERDSMRLVSEYCIVLCPMSNRPPARGLSPCAASTLARSPPPAVKQYPPTALITSGIQSQTAHKTRPSPSAYPPRLSVRVHGASTHLVTPTTPPSNCPSNSVPFCRMADARHLSAD
ncbi:hypothetical protein PENSPDRAFT_31112 [Peniophora sp. CONT]|nr:hypothetical protein PENSPDRAFT_31112 [Peniophora sp. CONT]